MGELEDKEGNEADLEKRHHNTNSKWLCSNVTDGFKSFALIFFLSSLPVILWLDWCCTTTHVSPVILCDFPSWLTSDPITTTFFSRWQFRLDVLMICLLTPISLIDWTFYRTDQIKLLPVTDMTVICEIKHASRSLCTKCKFLLRWHDKWQAVFLNSVIFFF